MFSELVNPIHFFFAFAPLAVYLSLLGMINLGKRPFITTGVRDAAALGIGVGGLVINENEQVLVVQERYLNTPHWKVTQAVLCLRFELETSLNYVEDDIGYDLSSSQLIPFILLTY